MKRFLLIVLGILGVAIIVCGMAMKKTILIMTLMALCALSACNAVPIALKNREELFVYEKMCTGN